MKLYLVRHGSTEQGERHCNQDNSEPLNEKGRSQAKEVAKRFDGVDLDMVISSPLMRAMETAKKIRNQVVVSELFSEIRKPKELIGKCKIDVGVAAILKTIEEKYATDSGWHYSDEENFDDLKTRGIRALDYLISLNQENVLVVSHARFMELLVGLMLFGNEFTGELFNKLRFFLRVGNTGITVCVFEDGKWKLHCWNDRSHWMEG